MKISSTRLIVIIALVIAIAIIAGIVAVYIQASTLTTETHASRIGIVEKNAIAVGKGPGSIAYDPSNNYLYVTNVISNAISVIDTSNNSMIKQIPLGGPRGIVYDPVNQELYATCYGANYSVAMIDTVSNTVKNYVRGQCTEGSPVFADSNNLIYIATADQSGEIQVINTTTDTIAQTITVQGEGSFDGLAYDSFNHDIYVIGSQGEVLVLNTGSNKVVTTIQIEKNTQVYDLLWIAANTHRNAVYVASAMGDNYIRTINGTTNTVVSSYGFTSASSSYAYDASKDIYFVAEFQNLLTAINGTNMQPLGSITIGYGTAGIVFVPLNGELYVANGTSDLLNVFQVQYP
ncbi:MAG: YncE family protein [Nitrososphaerales archaeon]